MKIAISFTNFGPYHLARLRALAIALRARGDRLVAYETASAEQRYPWLRSVEVEPFTWVTLLPDRALESLSRSVCRRAMREALERDRPDALGIVGYSRPESMAMLGWALESHRPTVLMSESQECDHPRVWWKEAIKRRRVRRFSAGLVGGPRHADYLAKLGLPIDRIAFGYNAVDNAHFARLAERERRAMSDQNRTLHFIAVSRFVPEKNLTGLIESYARYRRTTDRPPWDLVLCGGGPEEAEIDAAIEASGFADAIHRPGFLQGDDLARRLAHASAFVHPSRMEPWGLVANEAAACGLPLLISNRAGCVETLVPDPIGTTGRRFDPASVTDLTDALLWMAHRSEFDRSAMGRRAAELVAEWGPDRFARGTIQALDLAFDREDRRHRRQNRFGHLAESTR